MDKISSLLDFKVGPSQVEDSIVWSSSIAKYYWLEVEPIPENRIQQSEKKEKKNKKDKKKNKKDKFKWTYRVTLLMPGHEAVKGYILGPKQFRKFVRAADGFHHREFLSILYRWKLVNKTEDISIYQKRSIESLSYLTRRWA